MKIGIPIQVVRFNDNRELEIDFKLLESLLLCDSIRNKKIIILSVAGDIRKGKSFLLNYFLRYLISIRSGNDFNWLEISSIPYEGFSYRGGSRRDTTGIVMWSEPLLINKNGEEIAVLLMDTQGSFDSEHTVGQTSKIFALSYLLSSIQIYNILHNLQEDNLQSLAVFSEYGTFALEETGEKPFQKLLFLIRDWSYPYEYEYGSEGGQKILNNYLNIREDHQPELKSVRSFIEDCFEEISCFLLPHPGKPVSTTKHFTGPISDIDPEFIECMKTLVPFIFDLNNITKKNCGIEINGYGFYQLFIRYVKLFESNEILSIQLNFLPR